MARRTTLIGCGRRSGAGNWARDRGTAWWLHRYSRSRLLLRPKPPDSCRPLSRLLSRPAGPAGLTHSAAPSASGRAWPRRAHRQRMGKACLLVGAEKGRDRQRRPRDTRNRRCTPNSSCTMRSSRTHSGLSVHSRTLPRWLTLPHCQLGGRDDHLLIGARGTVIGAERRDRPAARRAEEAEHRPGAHQDEHDAGDEADAADHSMKMTKAASGRANGAASAPPKRFRYRVARSGVVAVVGSPWGHYRGTMREKTSNAVLTSAEAAKRKRAAGKARAQGQDRARVKARRRSAKADAKAASAQCPGRPPRSKKRSAASPRPIRSRAASSSTSIPLRCWSRSSSPRRRPMPASTRRRRLCLRSPIRRKRWWRSARTACAI